MRGNPKALEGSGIGAKLEGQKRRTEKFFFSIESLYEKELHSESLSFILARHRRFIL